MSTETVIRKAWECYDDVAEDWAGEIMERAPFAKLAVISCTEHSVELCDECQKPMEARDLYHSGATTIVEYVFPGARIKEMICADRGWDEDDIEAYEIRAWLAEAVR